MATSLKGLSRWIPGSKIPLNKKMSLLADLGQKLESLASLPSTLQNCLAQGLGKRTLVFNLSFQGSPHCPSQGSPPWQNPGFGLFGLIIFPLVFDRVPTAPLERFLVDLGAILAHFGSHFGVFLRHFLDISAKVKIELPLQRESNFQGPGPTKIDTFCLLFLYLFWKRLRSIFFLRFFVDFAIMWGPIWGSQGGPFRTYFILIFLNTLLEAFWAKMRGTF